MSAFDSKAQDEKMLMAQNNSMTIQATFLNCDQLV